MSEPLRPDILLKLGRSLPHLAPVARRVEPLQTPVTRLCLHCGGAFQPKRANHNYCRKECWGLAHPTKLGTGHKRQDVSVERAVAVAAVCAIWPRITPDDIARQDRRTFITQPRFAAFELVKQLRPAASLPDIGRAFSRDHTTVINGRRRCEELMAEPEYAARFREAETKARAALGLPDG